MSPTSPTPTSAIELDSSIPDLWVLHTPVAPAETRKRADPSWATAKHVFDVVCATMSLVLLFPVIILISLLIRVTSKGPVFFLQLRRGYQGEPFWLLKFRTMTIDAEDRFIPIELLDEATRGVPVKIPHDVRVTPIGRWLRRTGLDDLPQLVNVLLGDMSLVGPAPLPMPDDARLQQLNPEACHLRLTALPGLTGPWQLERRGKTDPLRMLEMDLDYIEHWSFRGDLSIVARSLGLIFRSRHFC